jgi:hypothetical protein
MYFPHKNILSCALMLAIGILIIPYAGCAPKAEPVDPALCDTDYLMLRSNNSYDAEELMADYET